MLCLWSCELAMVVVRCKDPINVGLGTMDGMHVVVVL